MSSSRQPNCGLIAALSRGVSSRVLLSIALDNVRAIHLPRSELAMQNPVANVGDRLNARFIDALIAWAIGAAAWWFVDHVDGPRQLPRVMAMLYALGCDGGPGGRSVGKRLIGCAVVRMDDGRPCHSLQSVVRNLSLLLFGVVDLMFIAGKQRRRLGDWIAGTQVVRLER